MIAMSLARGCVYTYRTAGNNTTGFFALSPGLTGAEGSPVLISGINIDDSDILSPMPTLSNFRVLYSLGPGFGNVRVNLNVLLGSNASGRGAGYRAVSDYFSANRVSATNAPIKAAMPGGSGLKFYLQSINTGDPDPVFNTMPVSLGGVLAGLPQT